MIDGTTINSEEDFNFKKEFLKYLYFWKLFLGAILILLFTAFLYMRYTPKVYNVVAKIKIIDDEESNIELPMLSNVFSNSNINLENEIEVIKSYPILKQVIENQQLYTSVVSLGRIKNSLITNYPFEIDLKIPTDSIVNGLYEVNTTDDGFEIFEASEKKKYSFKGTSTNNFNHDLPFDVSNFNKKLINENVDGFLIRLSTVESMILYFKKSLKVSQVGNDSEIIQLEFDSENPNYSQTFLNELITVFNNDGVKDRQFVHKRTIDFVNERYSFLSKELDSIEISKQLYKTNNKLVDLSANSAISLEQSYKSEEEIFLIENQILLAKLLKTSLNESKLELLPANIGIENSEINSLIIDYNNKVLERKKLVISAGSNNPSIKQLENILSDYRSNIIFSIQNYLNQLKKTQQKLTKQSNQYNSQVLNLPKKEKILRSIERNQKIKEALYLFLLQKREEAQVNFAVTEPSVKVVEKAISNNIPVSPNRSVIFLLAILLGLLVPFAVLYTLFLFNDKIYSKNQLLDLNLPLNVAGEIPLINTQANTTISSSSERSPLAESFRVLASNLKFYVLNKKNKGHVIMVSSTIKGEGKTFCAINLAYTKATLGHKVLLIGADLHNPQIHSYLNIEKDFDGLVNYLVDDKMSWKKAVKNPDSIQKCDVLIGGQIPPNPAQLLNNDNFKKLIDEAKEIYDYIVIDTPPCLLVSDTLSISHMADLLLFVVRCNHTKIGVLDFIKDSYIKNLIKDNSMFILNGLGANNSYGYGYAYNYSYGYNYSYNYNYGYGYEYRSEE